MCQRTRSTTGSISRRGSPRLRSQRAASRGAHHLVVVEVALRLGRRLADVVQQGGEEQRLVPRREHRRGVHGAQRVGPQVVAGHLRLRHAPLRRQVRRQGLQEARLLEQPQPARRRGRGQQALQFAAPTLGRHVAQQGRRILDGAARARLQVEAQDGRQPDRPQEAQRVLVEADGRVADRADETPRQVRATVVRIDQAVGPVGHGIDGEVAPGEVLGEARRERHAVGPPVVAVAVVAAEGRHLHLGRALWAGDQHGAVAGDLVAAGEAGRHLRAGGRRWPRPSRPATRSSRRSRSDPPTTYAWWPSARSPSRTAVTWAGRFSRGPGRGTSARVRSAGRRGRA